MASAFPYDINNLLGGRVRVLWAPVSQAAPASPKDIIAQNAAGSYNPLTGWVDFGAGRDASTYERGLTFTEWEIQQQQAAVIEVPTTVTRHVSVSIAEITEKTLQVIEQAAATGTVAATTGLGAQKEVGMGNINSLTRYRVAFISMRDTASGFVTELDGTKRGRFVTGVGWQASITADAASLEQAKATMSAFTVTFNFYPDATQAAGKEYGVWWLENTGTLT